jgi:hypothetical protein
MKHKKIPSSILPLQDQTKISKKGNMSNPTTENEDPAVKVIGL